MKYKSTKFKRSPIYKLTLRTKHNPQQKEKVSYARQVFASIAVAMVVKT